MYVDENFSVYKYQHTFSCISNILFHRHTIRQHYGALAAAMELVHVGESLNNIQVFRQHTYFTNILEHNQKSQVSMVIVNRILDTNHQFYSTKAYGRRDSMIFNISWAADPGRSGTVWVRSGMVPSCHINYQKFGEFMFG